MADRSNYEGGENAAGMEDEAAEPMMGGGGSVEGRSRRSKRSKRDQEMEQSVGLMCGCCRCCECANEEYTVCCCKMNCCLILLIFIPLLIIIIILIAWMLFWGNKLMGKSAGYWFWKLLYESSRNLKGATEGGGLKIRLFMNLGFCCSKYFKRV